MKDNVLKNLNEFINFHLEYQLKAYQLSNKAHEISFPGFAHWFQIEAADAVVHMRRIMNYINGSNSQFDIINNFKKINLDNADIFILIEELIKIKKSGLELANKYSTLAAQEGDFLTVKFYEWFLIDFYEEIGNENDLIGWMKMNKNSLYEIDKKMSKSEEPDTLKVIDPFSIHS